MAEDLLRFDPRYFGDQEQKEPAPSPSQQAPISASPRAQEPAIPERGTIAFSPSMMEAPSPPTALPFGEEVKQAAKTGLARGALQLVGLPGEIEGLGRAGARYFGYDVGAEPMLPTSQRVISTVEGYSPSAKELLSFKPEGEVAKYIKSAAEFLPSAVIPGGQIGLGARAAGAIGAGLASHGVEHALRNTGAAGTGYETAGQLGAALAGGMAGTGAAQRAVNLARGFVSPGSAALDRAASAAAKDMSAATMKQDLPTAISQGVPPAAIAGTQYGSLLKQASKRAGEETQGTFNTAVKEFRREAAPSIQKHIDNVIGSGTPIDALKKIDEYSSSVSKLNDANYSRVMALPEAQVIPPAAVRPIENRIRTVFGPDFINEIGRNMAARGEDIVSAGLIQKGRNFQIAPGGASLRFWDDVKGYIDDSINKLYDPVTRAPKPGTNSQISALMSLKKGLTTDTLDKIVKEYPKIRFEGAELYGARNAIDAGYRYFNDKQFGKIISKEKFAESKLNPAQKSEFAYGYAGALRDLLQNKPEDALSMFSGKNAAQEIRKARFALGNDVANDLVGRTHAQFLNSKIKELAGSPEGGGFARAGLTAGVLAEIAASGQMALQNLLAFQPSISAISAVVLGSLGKAAYNARERRIAEEIIRQAADPATWGKLGDLIARNKEAQSVMNKLIEASRRTAPVIAAPEEVRPQRASGGRVNMADQIMAQIDKARKELQSETGALLNHDDETVVKALKVANERI